MNTTPAAQPDGSTTRAQERARVWRWRNAICSDALLTPGTKLVALRLSFHYDWDKRWTWAPQQQLADECGLHANTVQVARAALVERGALIVLAKPHRDRATRYGLADPAAWHTESLPQQGTESVPQNPLGTQSTESWGNNSGSLAQGTVCTSSTRGVPDEGTTYDEPSYTEASADASTSAPSSSQPSTMGSEYYRRKAEARKRITGKMGVL